MIKVLRKELLIYFVILAVLSLFMHPERISMIDTPMKLLHAFAWSFGVYLIVAILRGVTSIFMKFFKKRRAEG